MQLQSESDKNESSTKFDDRTTILKEISAVQNGLSIVWFYDTLNSDISSVAVVCWKIATSCPQTF